ncbi:MAG: hypothetical protein KC468_03960 [Myxococcales bacterium]|nr:hypothetical protein [Myxococcales bacterium]
MDADLRLEQVLREAGVDACLLALHGTTGGSGRIQALLERAGVPYAGPNSRTTARAFDKLRARACLAEHNVPVPTTVDLGGGDARGDDRTALPARMIGWPAVLKPRFGSQQRGLVHLEDQAAVADVLSGATRPSLPGPHLLERTIRGALEVQVVLFEGRVLGSMQIERTPSANLLSCPPELARSSLRGVENLARNAAAALGLGQAPTRVDVLLSVRHNEVVLEVEPLPPLHRDGVVALVARSAGISYESLVARVIHRMVVERSGRSPRVRPSEASALAAAAL